MFPKNVFIKHIKVVGHWLVRMAQPKIHSAQTEFKTPRFSDICYIDLFLKKLVLHINNKINH